MTKSEVRLDRLYSKAAEWDVEILHTKMATDDAACYKCGDEHYISIDKYAARSPKREVELLSHELSHVSCGFTPRNATKQALESNERRAKRHAADRLISWEEFKEAISDPWNEDEFSLAEYLEISMDMLRWVIRNFQHKGLLPW